MKRAALLALLSSACVGGVQGSGESQPDSQPDAAPTCPHQGCPSECEVAGVDEVGRCTADAEYAACVDDAVVVTACDADTRCLDTVAGPTCATSAQACGDVGPQGRCRLGVLTRCDDGWPIETDCPAEQHVCAYAGDGPDQGYRCLDASTLAASEVTGVVSREERPVSPGQLGDPVAVPTRGVNVWLIRNSDDAVLDRSVTSDDGSYVLRHDAPGGTPVRVTAGTSSEVGVRPIRVIRSNGNTHGYSSESFAAAASSIVDFAIPADSTRAPAFSAFDALVTGFEFTIAAGATNLVPMQLQWQDGSGGGSYYTGNNNTIHLSSADGWDDVVVLHEFGHYHQDEYGWSDSPGGTHPSSGGDDPRLAWGEGQATYIALAAGGFHAYIDTNTVDGGWYVELEDRIHETSMSGGMAQWLYEWTVAEVMFDMCDAPDQDLDADPVTGTDHFECTDVTSAYFFSNDYVGRGRSGVDLVDWLDGFFWSRGTESCDTVSNLLSDWYQFPYDFDGPTACP